MLVSHNPIVVGVYNIPIVRICHDQFLPAFFYAELPEPIRRHLHSALITAICLWKPRKAARNLRISPRTKGVVEMGVSENRGTPKWMVYNGKPYWNGWFGGTTIFGNTHMKQILKTRGLVILEPLYVRMIYKFTNVNNSPHKNGGCTTNPW